MASFTSGTTAYSITGGLFGPLLNWGQKVRRVEIERLRTEEEAMRYEQSVMLALGEVQGALVAIRTLKDEQQARQAHVDAAVHAQFLSQQLYDKGVTSYLEALESPRQAFESQLLLASVRRQLLQNHMLLYRALGGGWPTEQEKKAEMEGRYRVPGVHIPDPLWCMTAPGTDAALVLEAGHSHSRMATLPNPAGNVKAS